MTLSTHVLDASRGVPAGGVGVRLTTLEGQPLGEAVTDDDGRVRELAAELGSGAYRLTFATGAYFAARGQQGFYPEVVVTFTVTDADVGAGRHHHVPLLLSPYAYSTYRGS
jgi:5-hydroxyisourate hydrolase